MHKTKDAEKCENKTKISRKGEVNAEERVKEVIEGGKERRRSMKEGRKEVKKGRQ